MIADLCGYAERFVFDRLRKAYLFFLFFLGGGGVQMLYIFYL